MNKANQHHEGEGGDWGGFYQDKSDSRLPNYEAPPVPRTEADALACISRALWADYESCYCAHESSRKILN